jgi:ethanolamine ammonia-lyase large subunit
MVFRARTQHESFSFDSLKILLARASPFRSADALAGICARSEQERIAAQHALADVPLKNFLKEPLICAENDEVSALIFDSHCQKSFAPIASLTVGELRDWLLADSCTTEVISNLQNGLIPEMAAACSKLMRLQDLIYVAHKCQVVTQFRNTLGLPGRFSTRLQPNHPTDNLKGILASTLDGLLLGNGDAVIGINPASDNLQTISVMLNMLDELRISFNIPTQTCVLTHISSALELINQGAPVDIVFQSIAGSEAANRSFGVSISLIQEAYEAALSLNRGTLGQNFMYFETGQGSALSANAHYDVDAQTMEARAYAVAKKFKPLLVNSVVGFIGPEYLYNGKQIIRAGLEDHFCAKLLGLPMGCDVCFTNHADADLDDIDNLLTLLANAGCNFIMGVPGSDDIMLNYQSTSFHDALYIRALLGLRPAPEFDAWLQNLPAGLTHKAYLSLIGDKNL